MQRAVCPFEPTDARRRDWLRIGAAASMSTLLGCASSPTQPVSDAIAPFSGGHGIGERPFGWHDHVMRRDLPVTRYRTVERDGRRVAHALAERSTSGLRCDVDIDPHVAPWLSWDWRVDNLPLGATVSSDEVDDAPARVAIAFDGDFAKLSLRELIFQEQVQLFTGHQLPYATLMYVWDGQAVTGSVFCYARSSRIRYLVVENGATNLGRWMGYRRNLVADYRHVFGEEPGRVRSVGVLTDSDDLRNQAEAWFGDIVFTHS